MRRATGYFVMLITCISGHISPVLRPHNGKKNEILTADWNTYYFWLLAMKILEAAVIKTNWILIWYPYHPHLYTKTAVAHPIKDKRIPHLPFVFVATWFKLLSSEYGFHVSSNVSGVRKWTAFVYWTGRFLEYVAITFFFSPNIVVGTAQFSMHFAANSDNELL